MKPALLAALILAAGPVSAEVVTPIGDLVRNTNVTVSGTVDRLTDEDEFILADASGTVRVDLGPNFVPLNAGDAVTVRGFVDDDLRLEIYAREIVGPDGTTIRLEQWD